MNLERFSGNEITFERVYGHLVRRIQYLRTNLSWYLSEAGRQNRKEIAKLHNKYVGQQAVIICNGPSINHTNMDLIKDKVTFCMNRSYLMFEKWGFIPSYYTLTNELVLRQFTSDIKELSMPKFTDFSYRKMLRSEDDAFYFRLPPRLSDSFEGDIAKPLTSGGTVTFATLQLAYFLGFKDVIIIGMDHRFKAKGVPSAAEVRIAEKDEDHLHPDYFPKGMKWELPDLLRSELAYEKAREAYEKDGRRIIDATVNGACTVFPKMPLEEALS